MAKRLSREQGHELLKENVFDFNFDMYLDIHENHRGHESEEHFLTKLKEVYFSDDWDKTYKLFKEVVFPGITEDEEIYVDYIIACFVDRQNVDKS